MNGHGHTPEDSGDGTELAGTGNPSETTLPDATHSPPAQRRATSNNGKLDLATVYMREVGKRPALTPEQELSLFERYERLERRALDAALTTPTGLQVVSALVQSTLCRKRPLGGIIRSDAPEALLSDELLPPRIEKVLAHARDLGKAVVKHGACLMGSPQRNTKARRAAADRLHEAQQKLGDTLALFRLDRIQRTELLAELERYGERLNVAEQAPRDRLHLARRELLSLQAEAGLPIEELRGVLRDIQTGERAARRVRARIVESYLRLVISVATQFRHRGLPLLDLVQEGNIGLMKAIDRFDHRRGFRLSTYAIWWIRQAIHRAVANQSHTIRVPVNLYNDFLTVSHAQQFLCRKLGRDPESAEIAELLEMPPGRVAYVQDLLLEPLSLEQPTGSQETASLSDVVPDRTLPSPAEAANANALSERLDLMMNALPARHRKLLRMRFGLGGEKDHTLTELGQAFHVSRERARQLQYSAMDKISRGPNRRVLKEYLRA